MRVSFSGGGSDLTYYFVDRPGAVLSTTVALYSHATLIPRGDKQINIYSEDLETHEQYLSLIELLKSVNRGLLRAVVSVIKPVYGFDLYVRSDFPVGSGLGGSSAVATAVVAAFNEMRLDRWTTYEVAELAFQAERVCFGIAGGWQDQYASAFGGLALGQLAAGRFVARADNLAQDAGDRFIFDTANANLWYDSNGSAAGGLTQLADLQAGATMTAADIFLI